MVAYFSVPTARLRNADANLGNSTALTLGVDPVSVQCYFGLCSLPVAVSVQIGQIVIIS